MIGKLNLSTGDLVMWTSGAFIAGGLFAYFVMLPFSLECPLGVGDAFVCTPTVTTSTYLALPVIVMYLVGVLASYRLECSRGKRYQAQNS